MEGSEFRPTVEIGNGMPKSVYVKGTYIEGKALRSGVGLWGRGKKKTGCHFLEFECCGVILIEYWTSTLFDCCKGTVSGTGAICIYLYTRLIIKKVHKRKELIYLYKGHFVTLPTPRNSCFLHDKYVP